MLLTLFSLFSSTASLLLALLGAEPEDARLTFALSFLVTAAAAFAALYA
jgi:dTDP-4-amino-4,6-dideoxygalactose transaminase